jgi:hypothetical protein
MNRKQSFFGGKFSGYEIVEGFDPASRNRFPYNGIHFCTVNLNRLAIGAGCNQQRENKK